MILREIDFGPCLDAAGTRGFFGRGYPFHRIPLVGPMIWNFQGSTFVAKTTTTPIQYGNMPLKGSEHDFEPKHWFPQCVWSDMQAQIALNSVGLSGPGSFQLMVQQKWQKRTEPFMVSWAPVGPETEWESQARRFVRDWGIHMSGQNLQVGLQVSLSCPNTGTDLAKLVQKAHLLLNILQQLCVPLVVKLNVLVDPARAIEISKHPACDALCISNTVPFGELSDKIDWHSIFPIGSPLVRHNPAFGNGGLSGKPLLPLVIDWLQHAFDAGLKKPINAGGGILEANDVDFLVENTSLRPGIDSVFIGSIAMLNPLGIRSTIRRAHKLLGQQKPASS